MALLGLLVNIPPNMSVGKTQVPIFERLTGGYWWSRYVDWSCRNRLITPGSYSSTTIRCHIRLIVQSQDVFAKSASQCMFMPGA